MDLRARRALLDRLEKVLQALLVKELQAQQARKAALVNPALQQDRRVKRVLLVVPLEKPARQDRSVQLVPPRALQGTQVHQELDF
jgi:subtilisin-like proprotein convertase family protein